MTIRQPLGYMTAIETTNSVLFAGHGKDPP